VQALETGLRQPGALLVIDELGKMEFLSPSFLAVVERAMGGPNPVLGTILYRPHPLADRFRRAPGVKLIQVTATNRGTLPAELATLLG
jgi:nucleoside-triphosphatase